MQRQPAANSVNDAKTECFGCQLSNSAKPSNGLIKDVAVFPMPLHDIPKSAPLTPCLRGTGEQHIDNLSGLGQ